MAPNIKSAETDRLARELAALTGEIITDAVTRALEMAGNGAASRPILDKRSDEEILGYNEFGTFD